MGGKKCLEVGKVSISNSAMLTKFTFFEHKITLTAHYLAFLTDSGVLARIHQEKCFDVIIKIHQGGEKLQLMKAFFPISEAITRTHLIG